MTTDMTNFDLSKVTGKCRNCGAAAENHQMYALMNQPGSIPTTCPEPPLHDIDHTPGDLDADVDARKERLTVKAFEECFSVNPKDALGAAKVPLSLVPPSAVIHCAEAFRNGAEKYGPYNWREKDVKASIYVDAALRHIYSWFDGEECAQDSGVHHLGHAMACLAILIDAYETKGLEVDIPSEKGVAADLLNSLHREHDAALEADDLDDEIPF